MAALQCEICGGKLMGRPGGIFECDSCGMEYDTAWAKAKIQEIKGTVKVEGTVQVAGTVKVEGVISIENLLKRGWLELEDRAWDRAARCFDDALNLNPECGEAYLGRACIRMNAPSLKELVTNRDKVMENADFKKSLHFLNPETAAKLQTLVTATTEKFRQKRLEAEQEQERQKQEKKRQEEEHRRQKCEQMQAARKALEPYRGRIVGGQVFSLGIKANGSVVARGASGYKADTIESWRDIICLASNYLYTVGVKSDGTAVVAAGSTFMSGRDKGEKEAVSQWTDLTAVAVGGYHTVGLKSDGTVVAAGGNSFGQCNVSDWTDIVAISAGTMYTVGLRADGTVVVVGENEYGCCDVSYWQDMVAIATGSAHTVGLRKDGTVVATGRNDHGECVVDLWRDIVDICAYGGRTIGLRKDGTVKVTGVKCYSWDYNEWQNIVAIATGGMHTLGLTQEGKVIALGANDVSQCDINGFPLFRDAASLQPLRRVPKKSREDLKREEEALTGEYRQLSALFAGKRRKEIEARLAEIQTELKGLN